jgi:hypothetical protein
VGLSQRDRGTYREKLFTSANIRIYGRQSHRSVFNHYQRKVKGLGFFVFEKERGQQFFVLYLPRDRNERIASAPPGRNSPICGHRPESPALPCARPPRDPTKGKACMRYRLVLATNLLPKILQCAESFLRKPNSLYLCRSRYPAEGFLPPLCASTQKSGPVHR